VPSEHLSSYSQLKCALGEELRIAKVAFDEPLRIIGDGSDVADGQVPDGLDDSDLLGIYRRLVLLRTFDERAVSLQRQGRLGTYPMFSGEEATQAGPLFACTDDDWVFPSYRQGAIGILRGLPPSVIFKYRRGYGGTHGFWNPRDYKVGPSIVSIGTHLSHAVGVAWAARIKGDATASLVWFGDGATSEGDFHEAMNFAAVFKAGTVFFCTNNQWAISTPVARQTATDTLAVKAGAYGMPSVRVDGFDALACFEAARTALIRAREGDGPTLIEAFCYRLSPHATADDPRRYRDETESERWRKLEPVGRMRAFLERIGVLDEARTSQIADEARIKIDQAVREMESVDPPGPDVLFETIYAGIRLKDFDSALAELTVP
jgi:pyruvate dehydrogenase E1 component alpha subunit